MRTKLQNRRGGYHFEVGEGSQAISIQTGEYPDGTIGEVWISQQKEGSFCKAVYESLAMVVSLALQSGVPLESIGHSLRYSSKEVCEIFDELQRVYCRCSHLTRIN